MLKKIRKTLLRSKQDKLIVSIGRLHKFKGFQYTIPVIGKMSHTKYVIIGPDNGYGSHLKKLAKSSKNIHFLGQRGRDIIVDFLYAADLIVIPSLSEPFGIIGLEAMAAGKPIIVNPVGGLTDFLIDGDNCLYSDVRNPDDLEYKIQTIFERPAFAKKIAVQAKRDVKRYTWDTIADKYIELLKL